MATPNKTLLDLKNAVQLWLNRDDPEVVNAIPTFISLAEQEFARSVKIPLDEGLFVYSATGNIDVVNIPDDCLSPIGVWVASPKNQMKPLSYTRINGFAYFDILEEGKDKGRYFCKYQNQWLFYPELEENDVVSVTYHRDLVPMVSDADTSPALKYGFDLMLYWTLKHASVFLRDDEQEQFWTQKAQEALITMTQTFEEQHWAGSPLQVLNP